MFDKLLLIYRGFTSAQPSQGIKKIWSPKRENIHQLRLCGGKCFVDVRGQKKFLLIYLSKGEKLSSRTPLFDFRLYFVYLPLWYKGFFFLIFKQSHFTLLLCLKIRWNSLCHLDDSSLFHQGRTVVVAFLTFTPSLVVLARSRSFTETSESAAATLKRAKTDGWTPWHFTVMCHLHDGTP